MIGDVARDNVRVLSRGNLFKAVDEGEVELQLGQGLEGRSLPTGFLRILLILATPYRRWASYRLQMLTPWIDKWIVDELFAGILGQGVEQASYMTSI